MSDSALSSPPSPWLHRYALILAACTLGLVFAGGLVTSKGAGLSVPDWPLSYGQLMPEGWFEAENVRAEHGHRMIAGAVGIMTLILTIWVWRAEPRRWVRYVALATFGAVVIQALFGGLTVILIRPISLTVGHALLGQTFFCLTVALAVFTSPGWLRAPVGQVHPAAGALHAACLVFTAVVFVQLVLGAIMRHTEAGLAIHTFPFAFGSLAPPIDAASLREINLDRLQLGLSQVSAGQVMIHFSHRIGALAVCAAGIWLGVRVLSRHANSGALLFPVLLVIVLLIFQIVLGSMVVWTGKQPHLTTAHVAVGALILATGVVLSLNSFHLIRRAARGALQPSAAPEATT